MPHAAYLLCVLSRVTLFRSPENPQEAARLGVAICRNELSSTMFKLSAPYWTDNHGGYHWYIDGILNNGVLHMPQIDKRKAVFLPALEHLGILSAQDRVHVQLVDTAHPTIFLLTSGDAGTMAQAMRCAGICRRSN